MSPLRTYMQGHGTKKRILYVSMAIEVAMPLIGGEHLESTMIVTSGWFKRSVITTRLGLLLSIVWLQSGGK